MSQESDTTATVSRRKLEHLEHALNGNVQGPSPAGWDDVHLVHQSLPGISLEEVDLRTSFLGGAFGAPLWITGMTGGHPLAAELNARLARAAEMFGLAMGLGSQRAALQSETLMDTYRIARVAAPDAFLVANIGAPQLVEQSGKPPLSLDEVRRLVDAIGAQALAIHLNFLQEVVQPEGDTNARGCLEAIAGVVHGVDVPVLVKETGAGMSRESASMLVRAGASAIDVGGAGGTSMVRIEGARATRQGHTASGYASTFDAWGISTGASILETRCCGVPVIATGGVRTGLDGARALALGAHAVGVGLPFLAAADAGEEELRAAVERFIAEIRIAHFLTGSRTPGELRATGGVLLGSLRAWAEARDLL